MEVKKVAVGCDHAGYPYKDLVVAELHRRGIQITDYGTDSPASVDYPDFVHPVATDVESGAVDLGVVICFVPVLA
ncbi:MAG: RpiB/LacA/LacB family sugar-phosphate isomerase, partial [Phaeodactylibacter sp.]|nr:RpiB/LacA/LacB family sugar-phosphate isomerase [Phaeodactylibacter sp.]